MLFSPGVDQTQGKNHAPDKTNGKTKIKWTKNVQGYDGSPYKSFFVMLSSSTSPTIQFHQSKSDSH